MLDEDPELLAAMQKSMEVEEEATFRRALEASRMSLGNADSGSMDATSTTDSVELPDDLNTTVSSDVDEDLYVPGRLETALAIAGAGPTPQRLASVTTTKRPFASNNVIPESSMFGKPTLLLSNRTKTPTKPVDLPSIGPSLPPKLQRASSSATATESVPSVLEDSDDDLYMEEVSVPAPTHVTVESSIESPVPDSFRRAQSTLPSPPPVVRDDSDDDMEEIVPSAPPPAQTSSDAIVPPRAAPLTGIDSTVLSTSPSRIRFASPEVEARPSPISSPLVREGEEDINGDTDLHTPSTPISTMPLTQLAVSSENDTSPTRLPSPPASNSKPSDDSDEALTDWSRSPSPVSHHTSYPDGNGDGNEQGSSNTTRAKEDTWDAAQEMDPHVEEGEFARFISQVKGKDLDSVRREIDEEIKGLNEQRKAAMRDSEDVTQHMISQIMVDLPLFHVLCHSVQC